MKEHFKCNFFFNFPRIIIVSCAGWVFKGILIFGGQETFEKGAEIKLGIIIRKR